MIKVSVIIPVYNVEAFLPDCLDSVLSQTLKEIEVICIDDASPDDCGRILDDYAAKDNRMKVFHLDQNHRQGYGRNLGLKNAAGEYVYFLDSDDMIVPEAMEGLYEIAKKDNLDAIFFDTQTIFNSDELEAQFSERTDIREGIYPDKVVDGRELFDAFVSQNEWQVFVQRQFWRREFLANEGICFPENAEHEDQFFSFAGTLAAKRARYIRKAYFIRRCRENSVMTSKPAPKNFHGYFVNLYKMMEFIRTRNIDDPMADKVVLDLMSYMVYLWPIFSQTEDPASWFQYHHLEDSYLFFTYLQEEQNKRREYDEKRFEVLKPYKRIVIYGAGKIANRLFWRLSQIGMLIEEFVVTDKEGNPDFLYNRAVLELKDYKEKTDCIIVVAVARQNHKEISKSLSERGLAHFLYANDVIEGPITD